MYNTKFLSILLLVLLTGCVMTTGEIRENKFYLEGDFVVGLLDNDWDVVRQKTWVEYGVKQRNTVNEISFLHKKSNGIIGVNSMILDELNQARSLDVHAEEAVANYNGIKLSQKMTKIDGIDAVEICISGKYMVKYIFLKKAKKGYEIIYKNTPTYFDEYLGIFDKFVLTFKVF